MEKFDKPQKWQKIRKLLLMTIKNKIFDVFKNNPYCREGCYQWKRRRCPPRKKSSLLSEEEDGGTEYSIKTEQFSYHVKKNLLMKNIKEEIYSQKT